MNIIISVTFYTVTSSEKRSGNINESFISLCYFGCLCRRCLSALLSVFFSWVYLHHCLSVSLPSVRVAVCLLQLGLPASLSVSLSVRPCCCLSVIAGSICIHVCLYRCLSVRVAVCLL